MNRTDHAWIYNKPLTTDQRWYTKVERVLFSIDCLLKRSEAKNAISLRHWGASCSSTGACVHFRCERTSDVINAKPYFLPLSDAVTSWHVSVKTWNSTIYLECKNKKNVRTNNLNILSKKPTIPANVKCKRILNVKEKTQKRRSKRKHNQIAGVYYTDNIHETV